MKNILAIWVLVMATALSTFALPWPGGKPFTGKITYQIKVTGNVPPEVQSMMPNKAVYQLDEQFAKIDMTPSFFGGGTVIMDHEKQTMRALMDMPGNKYQLIMDEQLKEQAAKAKNITYTSETRTIAGYTCTKALVDSGDGNKVEVWFTDKIQVKNLDKMWGSLKGFPLEFSNTVPGQGITMLFTATEVKPGKVDKKEFQISSDYQPVTQEQLMNMMGSFSE